MKISSLILSTLMFYAAIASHAQTQPTGPLKFSLNEAREYALKHSPVLLNSARDVDIAKKMIWENTATGLPQANLSSAYAYSPKLSGLTTIFTDTTGSGSGENPFGNFHINPDDLKTSFSLDINVTQLVFSGTYIVGLKAAKVYASLSALAHNKSKIGIAENITNTYFTALVARQSKQVLDSTLTSVQKTLFEATQMFKNGFVESTDVDQLKILESNIRSSLSLTERQIELVERLLKFQMGIEIDQPVELTDQIDPLVTVMNLEAAVLDSFRVEDNVEYKMLDTQEKLMKLNMQVKMSQFLPTLSGYYNRHEDYDKNFFNDVSPNMFGLSLSFPLWSSGQRLSQVGQSRLEYMKAQTNKQMVEESLLIQYETALSGFLSARDIYSMQKENRDLALKIYKKSIIKFKGGMGSSLDLNQTQSQYFSAEGNYFNALMSLVSAKAKLESLLAKTEN
jgi:outer membrane protein TolC